VAGDVVELLYKCIRNNSAIIIANIYIYVNTTNNLSGTPIQLGIFISGTATRSIQMSRTLAIKGATTRIFPITATAATDTIANNGLSSLLTIDWTIDQYFIFAIGNTALGINESLTGDFYRIIKN
jgi:hypothetical protein